MYSALFWYHLYGSILTYRYWLFHFSYILLHSCYKFYHLLWCRYFQCVPMYGLFAPINKVTRVMAASNIRRGSGSVSRIPIGMGLAQSRERSGSQESISSIGSATSSASRSSLRLGITALGGQVWYKYSVCHKKFNGYNLFPFFIYFPIWLAIYHV